MYQYELKTLAAGINGGTRSSECNSFPYKYLFDIYVNIQKRTKICRLLIIGFPPHSNPLPQGERGRTNKALFCWAKAPEFFSDAPLLKQGVSDSSLGAHN